MNAPVLDPPADVDAEQALLGAMLSDESAECLSRLGGLEADDFYVDQHRWIYRAIWNLVERGEPVEAITVARAHP